MFLVCRFFGLIYIFYPKSRNPFSFVCSVLL